jgi:hypothetical protein
LYRININTFKPFGIRIQDDDIFPYDFVNVEELLGEKRDIVHNRLSRVYKKAQNKLIQKTKQFNILEEISDINAVILSKFDIQLNEVCIQKNR